MTLAKGLRQNIKDPVDSYSHWRSQNGNGNILLWILSVGLPRTKANHDAIWIVIDRLTKSAHFLPIK